ncbi:zeaxanthin epoxidase [Flavobacteriaceae bacterium AU392]|nr:zeaxanthin epoxidase [Flavobacteriaceae bacterium]RKM81456.1 zeaxanthin epoxidase [Flavobacteriaceae bacterium AU392]
MYTIIGAGIGGLTTALAFEKLGIEYQLFEREPELFDIGAGILLSPNALQVFEWLGILDDVKSSGNYIDRITLSKPNLSPLFDNSQDDVKTKFGYYSIAIHRAKLQKLLIKNVPEQKIHLNKSFERFVINRDKVKTIFQDETEYESNFLIGADGINSRVRKQLFPKSKIRYSGQTCWRGISNLRLDNAYKHRGMEIWGNQIRFGFTQIAVGRTYWFAVSLSKPNQKDSSNIKNELLKSYRSFHPLVNKLISSTDNNDIIRNDINDLILLNKWSENNICLIGDAAHATTPNMGQGGAQAIEDAYYLSNLINENLNQNVFQLFQNKRMKKVSSIVKRSWLIGKIAHLKYAQNIRNYFFKNIPQSSIKKKIIEVFDIDKFPKSSS